MGAPPKRFFSGFWVDYIHVMLFFFVFCVRVLKLVGGCASPRIDEQFRLVEVPGHMETESEVKRVLLIELSTTIAMSNTRHPEQLDI